MKKWRELWHHGRYGTEQRGRSGVNHIYKALVLSPNVRCFYQFDTLPIQIQRPSRLKLLYSLSLSTDRISVASSSSSTAEVVLSGSR